MSLKSEALSGAKWTTISSIANTVIQIIKLAILARLLAPTAFGLMAIVMVVIGFSKMFIDMGVSNAIIYKQEVSDVQLNTLYLVNIIVGVLLFILILLIAPVVANFYSDEELVSLINIVAITYLIKPWGQQFMVLLQKRMMFNDIAKTEILANIVTFFVVVILAYKGFGVYSLAIGAIVDSFVSTIGFIFFGMRFHRPKIEFDINQVKEFLSFGLYQMAEKFINYFSQQMDIILIGKLLGVEILGIYEIAKKLIVKPSIVVNPIVTKVTFPIMSKISNDIHRLKKIFLKTINYLSYVNFPIYTLIAILAEPIVLILFGNKWMDAVPIIQILSIAFILKSIGNPAGSLLLSRGKANVAFYWNLAIFVFYPISILIGSMWGIRGVALGVLGLELFLFFPNWGFIVKKTCNAKLNEYIRSMLKPLFITIPPAIITLIVVSFFTSTISRLILGIVLYGIMYIALLRLFDRQFFVDFKELAYNRLPIK